MKALQQNVKKLSKTVRDQGKPFQDLKTRCHIGAYVKNVDYVIPFEISGDLTVREALRKIRPHYFTKGSDRVDIQTIPEWQLCQELGIQVVTQVGLPELVEFGSVMPRKSN